MTIKNIQKTDDILWKDPAIIVILILGIGFVLTNILAFGRDDSLTLLINNILNPILALVVTIVASFLRRRAIRSPRSQTIWMGLIHGWGLWTIAEVIWTIAVLGGQEAPYPGWADLLWCIGYFFFYLALWQRTRSNTDRISRKNQMITAIIGVVISGFTIVHVLLPIIRAYEPSDLLEAITSLFYPLADLALLSFALHILFSADKGPFSKSWLWITLGFIVFTFSDLFFAYSSMKGLYYPDGHANFASVFLVDVPYTISYMLFLVGLVPLLKVRPQLPPRKFTQNS